MRNLLVLCADRRMIEREPHILRCYPDGKLIAEKAIEGIFPETYDRIVYAVLEEMDAKYRIGERILAAVGDRYPVEVVKLPTLTKSSAESAYQAIELAGIRGELAIRDSHNYIRIRSETVGNFIAGLDLTHYEKTIDDLRSKSFLICNGKNQILDIVEKHFRSDVISGGLYGFKRASDFAMAYERLNDVNYHIEKLYVSHIISYLIGYSQAIFHSVEICEFEDWSTSASWAKVQKRRGIYFLDLDELGCTAAPFADDILEPLQRLSRGGACLIAYTKETGLDAEALLGYLAGEGIHVLQLVAGCNATETKRIVDSKKSLQKHALEGLA